MSYLIEHPSFYIPIPDSTGVESYRKKLAELGIQPEFEELKDSKLELLQGEDPVTPAEGFLNHRHFLLRCMNASLTRGHIIDTLTQNGITEIIIPSSEEDAAIETLSKYGDPGGIDWRIAHLTHRLHDFGNVIPPNTARGQLRYKIQRNWATGITADFSHILNEGWLPSSFTNDDMMEFNQNASLKSQNDILLTNLLLERVIAALIAIRGADNLQKN